MTYSHNSVSNNFKMTTAAANTSTKTIRLKTGGAASGGGSNAHGNLKRNSSSKNNNSARISPSTPSAPISTGHSNSIASSTNNQHPSLSTSPTGSISSGSSTCSTGSTSSAGFFAYRQRQQQQQRNWQQQQLLRNSPTSPADVPFFGNNSQYYQGGNKHHQQQQYRQNGGGSAQKQRENQRSPHNRPSPVLVLANGNSSVNNNNNTNGSGRKNRSKPSGSPLQCAGPLGGGGKISPTHPSIPTALTHFAGSKCFDAPAPTALPKPPQHWTLSKSESKISSSSAGLNSLLGLTTSRSCASLMKNADAHTCGGHVVKSSKRNLLDDFDTHNLKLLLNVQS